MIIFANLCTTISEPYLFDWKLTWIVHGLMKLSFYPNQIFYVHVDFFREIYSRDNIWWPNLFRCVNYCMNRWPVPLEFRYARMVVFERFSNHDICALLLTIAVLVLMNRAVVVRSPQSVCTLGLLNWKWKTNLKKLIDLFIFLLSNAQW